MFHDWYQDEEEEMADDEDEHGGAGDGDIKWDSMFQDLKPT